MEQVRIGVIGLGIMGELYVKIYAAHPLAQVVAVSSRRQSRVDEIQKRYGVEAGIYGLPKDAGAEGPRCGCDRHARCPSLRPRA